MKMTSATLTNKAQQSQSDLKEPGSALQNRAFLLPPLTLMHLHLPATPIQRISALLRQSQALTLFEVILVVALLAGTMIYALPTMLSGTDHSATIRSFQAEVKSAFDSAVLTGLPHRLVFDLKQKRIFLQKLAYGAPSMILHRDEDPLQEAQRKEEHSSAFEEYRDLSRDEVSDLQHQRTYPASSPVLLAYKNLLGPPWQELQEFDHQVLLLGEGITITRYRTERHEEEQILQQQEPPPAFSLYFLPQGYVEQAYFVFQELANDGSVLEDLPPYIITIKAHQGVAVLSSQPEDATLEPPNL